MACALFSQWLRQSLLASSVGWFGGAGKGIFGWRQCGLNVDGFNQRQWENGTGGFCWAERRQGAGWVRFAMTGWSKACAAA